MLYAKLVINIYIHIFVDYAVYFDYCTVYNNILVCLYICLYVCAVNIYYTLSYPISVFIYTVYTIHIYHKIYTSCMYVVHNNTTNNTAYLYKDP